ncbi:MAG: hypothetical protein K2G70_04875 [Turicibacter sp.]|nr:hypothetical protein [Turicibacter sp.]
MKNIHDLTNLLRDVRRHYQAEFIDATEIKKRELELLKSGYIPGSKPYVEKEQEIQLNYDAAIVKAREKAAKKASEEIEDLKQWERTSVGIINTEALSRVNALRGIPVTTEELKQILAKHGTSNYWVQKAVASIAEESGIPVTDLPLDSPLDVKLNVLDGLSKQLDLLLEHYSPTAATSEAANARFLYLNDDVLNNSINIYNNGVQDLSETDAATRAYYKIRAMSGQMSKACAITNALRNLKKEDAKNQLLYQLAMDNSIKSDAYQVAGISDVMAEWKHGKAERYAKAVTMAESLKMMQDTEKIKEKLRGYIDRVDMCSEPENEFMRHEITKTYKKNTFIGKALEEMSSTERITLFGSDTRVQSDNGGAE